MSRNQWTPRGLRTGFLAEGFLRIGFHCKHKLLTPRADFLDTRWGPPGDASGAAPGALRATWRNPQIQEIADPRNLPGTPK
eukprot:3679069-Pyramimonas_sp.AAC.1